MAGWVEDVVDRLGALKLTGMSYEQAWTVAVREYPPRGRDCGPARPLLFGGMEEESLVDFTRRVCREAWLGERPELALLPTALADLGREHAAPRSRAVQALAA